MKKLPITAIIITNRSDQLFQQAVKSVLWADEIVIVDNNANLKSKDYKPPQFTFKHLVNPIQNFASIRNQVMTDARHEWVFFLDSDEKLPVSAVQKIAALVDNPQINGVVVFRSDVFYGKKLNYGEAGHQPILRMMRRDQANWVGSVHETAQVNGSVAQSDLEILHYAHPNISEFIGDVSRYAQMEAKRAPANSFWQNLIELLSFPLGKLLFGLFIQGGVIDGWRGLVYGLCMSLHSLLVRIYRYEQLVQTNQPSTHQN